MRWIIGLMMVAGVLVAASCKRGDAAARVTLYTSVDQPIAAPIIARFSEQTGIAVDVVYDAEASKTSALANRLLAEKDSPRADVYWGNEPMYSAQLQAAGVLDGGWRASGLRVRVIVARKGVAITSIAELGDAKYKGRIGIADPAFGTTGAHVVAMQQWDALAAEKLLTALRDNGVKVYPGNGAVVRAVISGEIDAGLTDNDDVAAAIAEGAAVVMVHPAEGSPALPTAVARVAGRPQNESARRLAEYLAAEAPAALVAAKFAIDPKTLPAGATREVDWPAAAKDSAAKIAAARKWLGK